MGWRSLKKKESKVINIEEVLLKRKQEERLKYWKKIQKKFLDHAKQLDW